MDVFLTKLSETHLIERLASSISPPHNYHIYINNQFKELQLMKNTLYHSYIIFITFSTYLRSQAAQGESTFVFSCDLAFKMCM